MKAHTERLETLAPFDFGGLLAFLGGRTVTGLEFADTDTFARTVRLPGGPAVLAIRGQSAEVGRTAGVELTGWLTDADDLPALRRRVIALLDLGCDPALVDSRLSAVPELAILVTNRPGIRIPGSVEPAETAVRGLLGQQISLIGATRAAERLVREHGDPLPAPLLKAGAAYGLTSLFPTPARLATVDPSRFAMPASRQQALHTLAQALAEGTVDLGGPDLHRVRESLLSLKGIGPWTAGYVLLRGCGDRDVWLESDLVLRREAARRGITAQTLRPALGVRSHASLHLWRAAAERRITPSR
ncbi:DNA-3-methyladenine glycosylase family protein [Enemella dayhoffiae]|uniref:DNA-3-methyladenine glycosylase family protein n=1 Tax=Enemella dayhoffiae TaxID=2016507 RepID=UPI001595C9CC|nr:DNA-3-methyladenine glycosylase 2 family protein [Enemella dayhoffiae]